MKKLKVRKLFSLYFLLFAFCLLPFDFGCGRIGPPKIPVPVVPKPITDLTGVAKNRNIQLEWTIPTTDTEGRELKELKTFEVYRREIPSFPPWEFTEESEGWSPKGSLVPFKVHEGVLRTVLPKGNTAFMVSNEGKPLIDASLIKSIKIRLRARESLEGHFLFITESDRAWDTDLRKVYSPIVHTSYATYASDLAPLKRKNFPIIQDSDFHEYTLDMSTISSWKGPVVQVGLLLVYPPEPEAPNALEFGISSLKPKTRKDSKLKTPDSELMITGREIELDYIRVSQSENPVATTYEKFPWFFIEDEEGWSLQPVRGFERVPSTISGVARGFLYAESQNAPIFLASRDSITLDTSQFNQIEIRMKVKGGKEGYLLFLTETDLQWDLILQSQYIPAVYTSYTSYFSVLEGNKQMRFSIPYDDVYLTYRFNMYTLSNWTGKIRRIGLFFPPLKGEQRVLIDSIQVLYQNLELPPQDVKTPDEADQPKSFQPPKIQTHPKVVTELSPPPREEQEPTEQEIRKLILAEQLAPQVSFISYAELPESKQRSLEPIRLAIIYLDKPEPAIIEKDRITFTDTGQLVNVDLEDLIKEVLVDPETELLPEISLKPWKKYEYYVLSTLDEQRQSDKSNLIIIQASKDPAPPPFVEARAEDQKVLIQWRPAFLTTDGSKLRSLAGYNLYRSTKPGDYEKPLNTEILKETQFIDTPLENGQTYYYVVRTVSETVPRPHESVNSKEVAATPIDLIPPASPTDLKGTFLEDSVRLYWNPNSEKDLIGYNIYRSVRKEGEYSRINESPIIQASYRDFNIERGKIYFYKVTALDDESPSNESKDSNIVEINTTSEE